MLQDIEGRPALPAPAPSAPETAGSRRPKGIDRAAVARLLAEGRPIAEVARTVGCSRQNLWRQVQRSTRLARLMRSAEAEARANAHGKLAGLDDAAVDTLRRAVGEGDNANIALHLADRFQLFERPAMADPFRLKLPPGWEEFASVLAAVTQRATAAARHPHRRFTLRDYANAWHDAAKERAAWRERGGVT